MNGIAGRLDSIVACCPRVTPRGFCEAQPCVDVAVGGVRFVLSQPTSSALVYLLSLMWVAAGVYFWRTRGGHRSRAWWGVAMVLGGVAAALAGTSYQAFGYEIKCAGREFCVWTSWWEVCYLTLQVACMDAMLVAVAYSCTGGRLRGVLFVFAGLSAVSHLLVTVYGATVPVRFLISFELLVLFTAPNLLLFFVINAWRYWRQRLAIDLALLGAEVWLVVTTAVYYGYMTAGLTGKLWARGVWFSDNDALHVLMMGWTVYVVFVVGRRVEDAV